MWLTVNDPGLAYFATHARIWELVNGALVALAVFSGRRLSGRVLPVVLARAGLVAVAIAMTQFNDTTRSRATRRCCRRWARPR